MRCRRKAHDKPARARNTGRTAVDLIRSGLLKDGARAQHPEGQALLRALLVGAAVMIFAMPGRAQTGGTLLELETKIPLGAVSGRIDHLAIDLKRQRLYLAELGNDSIGVVNLATNRVQSTMLGTKKPQGIAYEPSTDAVYVASAEDG